MLLEQRTVVPIKEFDSIYKYSAQIATVATKVVIQYSLVVKKVELYVGNYESKVQRGL